MSARIRTFQPGDLGQVVDIFIEAFSAPPWDEPWDRIDASSRVLTLGLHPTVRGWVACQKDDVVVGFALGFVQEDALVIEEMAVRRARQGQGIGTALLRAGEASAASEGLDRIEIVTARDKWPCHWYERLGYQIIDEREDGRVLLARTA